MFGGITGPALIGVLCAVTPAMAQQAAGATAAPVEHAVVFELGAAGDAAPGERFQAGGTFAVEVTPVDRWLELEIGVAATAAHPGIDVPVDILFKKPWQLSRTVEFMAGMGPEVVRASDGGGRTFGGVLAVTDWMFWPRRNIGWYVEPGYEVTFHGGTHHGVSVDAGLLVGKGSRRRTPDDSPD